MVTEQDALKMKNSTVLIVDDEPTGREVLRGLLLGQGYDLAFAQSGEEALEVAASLIPDLILLDVMMPGMDGFETCLQLRADPVLAEVPIIMVTALDDHASRLEGIEAGADDFVSKPFNRAELRTRVKTITRLNRFRRLQLERSKFEWVIEQSEDAYLVVNSNREISYANRQARLYLDLPSGQTDYPGKRFLQLAKTRYQCEPATAWATWPESLTNSDQNRYLVRPETAVTNAFWLQVDILLLDSGATPESNQIIRLRDVTAQMALQRDMWKFHAMVSHKLRTPIVPLFSGLDLLVSRASDLSTEDIVRIAERALAGVQRLHKSIDTIIHYMGASTLSRTSQERINLAQLTAIINGINADLDINDVTVNLDGVVDAESMMLPLSMQVTELILRELLENSRKFHPRQSPQVQIAVLKTDDDRAEIQVADDGLTLSPEQLAQVWTPYYQGEKFFTGEANGMGLGLSMVASLVWGAGGQCRMQNRDSGPGILVEITLPLNATD